MVESVEKCTTHAAKYLVRGVRWRRSGVIFFQAARGIIRALLQRWLKSDDYVSSSDRAAAFRKWLAQEGEKNPYIKHIADFAKAVGLNLLLDLSIREGDYDKCVKCALYFHALACSRGRFNYKDLLGEQIINWTECTPVEREAIAHAAFAPALNGCQLAIDEEYEALIKLFKAQLHPGLMNDAHLVRAVLLASYCEIVQGRAQLFLDWILEREEGSSSKKSSRPKEAATHKDREMINAYAAWITANFLKEASTKDDMQMPDGTLCITRC